MTLDDLAFTGLAFDTLIQVAQTAFPRLRPGRNKVTILRGPDEGHVQLVLGPARVAKERYIVESKGMDLPRNLAPAKYGEAAYAIYRLTAPAAITAASLGANLTFDPGPNQHIAISWSIDSGKTWNEVFRMTENPNRHHSQFEIDRYTKIENPTGAKDLLVKFDMLRNSKYFGAPSIRLYAFYAQEQPPDSRLAVELAWIEKQGEQWGPEKTKPLVVSKFPTDVELECAGTAVRFTRIFMQALP